MNIMGLDPLDVILQIIPSLKPKEREQVKAALGITETACDKTGHKYIIMGHRSGGWFGKASTKLFCPKCGGTLVEYH